METKESLKLTVNGQEYTSPVLPIVAKNDVAEFLVESPVGTLIITHSCWDDLNWSHEGIYEKTGEDQWNQLDELTTYGPAYLTYESWDRYNNKTLREAVKYYRVSIIRIGS